MLLIISSIFFILSAIGIAYFVWKHWKDLQSDNTSFVEAKRRIEVKSNILEDRLKRKLFSRIVTVWRIVLPYIRIFFKLVEKSYKFIVAKERLHRTSSEERKFKRKEASEKEAVIEEKLEKVEETINTEEREHQLLEVISLDPKNVNAYEELAELYVANKQLEDAVDVYAFLIKLKSTDISVHLDYADVLCEVGTQQYAMEVLIKAHEQEPKNPKIIDRITNLAIILGDKSQAKKSLKLLQTVNPDNKKIEEFQERIKEMDIAN